MKSFINNQLDSRQQLVACEEHSLDCIVY